MPSRSPLAARCGGHPPANPRRSHRRARGERFYTARAQEPTDPARSRGGVRAPASRAQTQDGRREHGRARQARRGLSTESARFDGGRFLPGAQQVRPPLGAPSMPVLRPPLHLALSRCCLCPRQWRVFDADATVPRAARLVPLRSLMRGEAMEADVPRMPAMSAPLAWEPLRANAHAWVYTAMCVELGGWRVRCTACAMRSSFSTAFSTAAPRDPAVEAPAHVAVTTGFRSQRQVRTLVY